MHGDCCHHVEYHLIFMKNGPIFHPFCREGLVHSWSTKGRVEVRKLKGNEKEGLYLIRS